MNIESFTDKALCVLFPRRCKYCGAVIVPEETVCENCKANLPKINSPVCVLCGHNKDDCACKKKKNYYKGIVAPFYYEDMVVKAVDRMKFQGKKYLCKPFADDMLEIVKREFPDIAFDAVTFIPFSKTDRKSRDFNHSEILAHFIADNIGVECLCLLDKIYDVPTQHTLGSQERRGNVFGIYETINNEKISGKTILLVDDIKTTGSTLNECAKMLKLAGANDVYCVTFAVTKKHKP